MLAVSGEKGWNIGMSPPFMRNLGKSIFAVGLGCLMLFDSPIRIFNLFL